MGLSKSVATIYAMIEEMDKGIARILASLEKKGLTDNTIVMVSSDNGPAFRHRPDQVAPGVPLESFRHNCGFKGAKGSVYEGGIRVPMILRWPDGLEGGREVTELIHFTDWLPTILEMAGIERKPGLALDGQNVLPILRGERPNEAPRQFWQWSPYTPPVITSNAAMRDGAWKLVQPQLDIQFSTQGGKDLAERYIDMDIKYKYEPDKVTLMRDPIPDRIIPEAKVPELYHIGKDPMEEHNLANVHPDRVSRMLAALETWFEDVETERRALPSVY
jgi:arylsulfatase A-like enzyme